MKGEKDNMSETKKRNQDATVKFKDMAREWAELVINNVNRIVETGSIEEVENLYSTVNNHLGILANTKAVELAFKDSE